LPDIAHVVKQTFFLTLSRHFPGNYSLFLILKILRPVQVFHVQEELSQLDGGLVYSIKFKLGDEFTMILPITGEKVKVNNTIYLSVEMKN